MTDASTQCIDEQSNNAEDWEIIWNILNKGNWNLFSFNSLNGSSRMCHTWLMDWASRYVILGLFEEESPARNSTSASKKPFFTTSSRESRRFIISRNPVSAFSSSVKYAAAKREIAHTKILPINRGTDYIPAIPDLTNAHNGRNNHRLINYTVHRECYDGYFAERNQFR